MPRGSAGERSSEKQTAGTWESWTVPSPRTAVTVRQIGWGRDRWGYGIGSVAQRVVVVEMRVTNTTYGVVRRFGAVRGRRAAPEEHADLVGRSTAAIRRARTVVWWRPVNVAIMVGADQKIRDAARRGGCRRRPWSFGCVSLLRASTVMLHSLCSVLEGVFDGQHCDRRATSSGDSGT